MLRKSVKLTEAQFRYDSCRGKVSGVQSRNARWRGLKTLHGVKALTAQQVIAGVKFVLVGCRQLWPYRHMYPEASSANGACFAGDSLFARA